jgi:hypothetical protein
MKQKDYENMMVASINYTLAKESAKKGIKLEKANRKEFSEKRPLYEIIDDRIAETTEPEITQGEYILLSKDISMATDYARENFLRQSYEDSIDYSQRIIEDCKLLMTAACYSEDMFGLDNIIKRAEALKQKAEIMKNNPETGHLILEMNEYARNEQYEKAAKLKKRIEKMESSK